LGAEIGELMRSQKWHKRIEEVTLYSYYTSKEVGAQPYIFF
jgi:hypothetical protein